jgi:transposase
VLDGILWVLRMGCRWRSLPERYGSWKTVSGRFYCSQRVGAASSAARDYSNPMRAAVMAAAVRDGT